MTNLFKRVQLPNRYGSMPYPVRMDVDRALVGLLSPTLYQLFLAHDALP